MSDKVKREQKKPTTKAYYMFCRVNSTGSNYNGTDITDNYPKEISWFLSDENFNKISPTQTICIGDEIKIEDAQNLIKNSFDCIDLGPKDLISLAGKGAAETHELFRRTMPELSKCLHFRMLNTDTISKFAHLAFPNTIELTTPKDDTLASGVESDFENILKLHQFIRNINGFNSIEDANNKQNIYYLFVDTEATGLNYVGTENLTNKMLQIGYFMTDNNFNKISSEEEYEVQWEESMEAALGDWARKAHTKSGLIDKCKANGISLELIEDKILNQINEIANADCKIVLAGSTIEYDRELIRREMPRLYNRLEENTFDITSILNFMKSAAPERSAGAIQSTYKDKKHTALSDIKDSFNFLHLLKRAARGETPAQYDEKIEEVR